MSADKLIEVCERLPGYYGYRPSMVGDDIRVDELLFRLDGKEKDCEYSISIVLDEKKCVETQIDARYTDGSIAKLLRDDEDFKDIWNHNEKLVQIIERFL